MKKQPPFLNKDLPHTPIMVKEILEAFAQVHLTTFYEGTIGAGGHAWHLLNAHREIEHYIGCDKDPEALAIAKKTLKPWGNKVELIQGNFADLDHQLEAKDIDKVDGFFLI